MSYEAYPSYQQPDADWLGKLPSHWDVRRNKTMLSLQRSKVGKAASDYQLLSLTLGGVIPRDITDGGGKIPAEFDTYQVVTPDDLIFCLFDIDETPRTIGIARDYGMITGAYSVYRGLPPCVPEYAFYYFLHIDSFKGLRPFYTGLRKVVRADTFSKVEIPAPSLEEQTQIAKFLDYETAKIGALIEKQQQLIAFLKEKRQAVISHAVTKGLNADAPMRDSGVEWLGEVPAHWKVGSLGYYATLNTGATPDRSKPDFWSGDIPWVKTGEVNYETIYESDEHITPAGLMNSAVCISPPGTLLMAMYGQGVTRGRVAILGISATYNQACVAISPAAAVTSAYLRYFFMSAYHAIRDGGNVTSQMNLNADIVKSFKVTIPESQEQKIIVSFLDNKLPRFEHLLEASQTVIQRMMERRAALISAAVTGKIDVRNWKAPDSKAEAEVV